VPTRQHQRILAIVLKRMKQRGFSLVSVDGSTENLCQIVLARPTAFGRHRPDAVGISIIGSVCIGEAKTSADVASKRTREQLMDYLMNPIGKRAEVLLGYPSSADSIVQSILKEIGASDCPQLELIMVPDELLDAK
jgi:hypothetical protein